MKGVAVAKRAGRIDGLLEYRVSGWVLAAIVIVLVVSVKYMFA